MNTNSGGVIPVRISRNLDMLFTSALSPGSPNPPKQGFRNTWFKSGMCLPLVVPNWSTCKCSKIARLCRMWCFLGVFFVAQEGMSSRVTRGHLRCVERSHSFCVTRRHPPLSQALRSCDAAFVLCHCDTRRMPSCDARGDVFL